MRFSRDRRGQSVVVGTVILFGFLILALSLYQVQIVPQQNSQVEFQHFEEVQNDLVELRNSILSAGQSERPQFVDVKLGTNYQTRLFAINPPDPAGTLRTKGPYNITISDSAGSTVNVSMRFIQYRPGYNELQVGSIWYDNSVLYLDERESGGGTVIIEDQNLVVDNGTLRITALQNEFQESGKRRVALELYPADDDASNLSELNGTLDVKIPTRISEADGYWNESIENGSVTYQGMDNTAYPSDSEVSALLLQVNSPNNVTVNSVGIQSEPSDSAVRDNVGPVGRDDGDSSASDPTPQCVEGDYNVNSNENGDIAYTGNVNINAKVTGNVVAGGTVNVNSGFGVDGDIQAGGSVNVNSGTRVTGDVLAGGNINDNTNGGGNGIQGIADGNKPGYAPCNS